MAEQNVSLTKAAQAAGMDYPRAAYLLKKGFLVADVMEAAGPGSSRVISKTNAIRLAFLAHWNQLWPIERAARLADWTMAVLPGIIWREREGAGWTWFVCHDAKLMATGLQPATELQPEEIAALVKFSLCERVDDTRLLVEIYSAPNDYTTPASGQCGSGFLPGGGRVTRPQPPRPSSWGVMFFDVSKLFAAFAEALEINPAEFTLEELVRFAPDIRLTDTTIKEWALDLTAQETARIIATSYRDQTDVETATLRF